MKLILAGPRDLISFSAMSRTIEECLPKSVVVTEVVSGKAVGGDWLGELWARQHKIPIQFFPVSNKEWKEHGKKAGHLRNRKMAEYGDVLVAAWDSVSTGTKNMIETMSDLGKPAYFRSWAIPPNRKIQIETSYGVGSVFVENGKIIKCSPMFQWALHLRPGRLLRSIDEKGQLIRWNEKPFTY